MQKFAAASSPSTCTAFDQSVTTDKASSPPLLPGTTILSGAPHCGAAIAADSHGAHRLWAEVRCFWLDRVWPA